MAENISQFKAGKTLLSLLQQHGVKDHGIQQITAVVAQLLDETRGAAAKGQQVQQQPPSVRDMQSADVVLQGLSLIIPRGKFDCCFYSDCMQVTNKQTSSMIPYGSIQHVLVIDAVPKQPSTTFLVLTMKKGQPVRQGKNDLDLVVLQTKDQPELTIPSPEVCQHLGPQLVGAAAVVLSQLLASYIEGVDENTFLTADSSVFSSSAGDLMVAANKGVQAGWLVPLSAGLCYLGKQGSFMPLSSISRVSFHRTGGSSATFDITIKMAAAAAGGAGKALELGQIDAAELPKLQTYCMNQRIRMGGDEEDSDGEAAAAAPTGSARAVAAAAAAGGAAAGAAAGGDDSDDDEDDEDFDPDAAGRRQRGAKRQRLEGGAAAAAAAAGAAEGSDDENEESEEDEGFEGDDGSGELSSDPELVATEDMSGMEDDGLGDFE